MGNIYQLLDMVGFGGLAIFLYFLIHGLKARISTLTETTREHQNTLDVVQNRAFEIEKLSRGYKKALTDFEELGRQARNVEISSFSNWKKQIKKKDKELVRLKTIQLERLIVERNCLYRIPKLEETLRTSLSELDMQLGVLLGSPLFSDTPQNHDPAVVAHDDHIEYSQYRNRLVLLHDVSHVLLEYYRQRN